MNSDSLFYFQNPKEFYDFVLSQEFDDGWRIYSGKMNSRGNSIRDKPYTTLLRNTFMEKGFFRKNVSVAEIVSWLDNFVYMMRILNQLKIDIDDSYYQDFQIFFEYRIKLSKNKRVDYILKYKEKILLLEFRTLDSFDKISSTWSKKKLELIVNRELIENYITDSKILTFAFVGLYEYENSKLVNKHQVYNNDQVKFLSKYIQAFMLDLKV